MSEKRKDNKGRILKTGESQRKDGLYQYRYKGFDGKRKTIYDSNLQSLREKESEIQASLLNRTDFQAGDITVKELVEKYLRIHQGVKYSTIRSYETITNFLQTQEIYYEQIKNVSSTMIKEWVVRMHENGRKYNTINLSLAVMSPAFQMACDENILKRNPCIFKLSAVIPKEIKKSVALTYEQQKAIIDFASKHNIYKKHVDVLIVLLGTGLRQGEMAGLTLDELDFENKVIHLKHQLRFHTNRGLFITSPKTKAGIRDIPMTDKVYDALKRMIEIRNKRFVGYEIDGRNDFINLGLSGRPKYPDDVWRVVKEISDGYHKAYPDSDMPDVHPHMLRHTFCTNMAHAGMDIKTLQYIMGHADISVTLEVYSHVNFEDVQTKMYNIMNNASV